MLRSNIRGLVGDTSFWIAAFDPRDGDHQRAAKLLKDIREHVILMPWPITYEILRTRTVANKLMTAAFERTIKEGKICWIDDTPYRSPCLEQTLRQAAAGRRSISLVDMVVRELMLAGVYRITRLLTFNAGDFSDVCQRQQITLWPDIVTR